MDIVIAAIKDQYDLQDMVLISVHWRLHDLREHYLYKSRFLKYRESSNKIFNSFSHYKRRAVFVI